MASIAENLKRLRTEARMTQIQLGEASGVTQSAVSKYETAEDVPEVLTVLRLAVGLGVPVDALVAGLDVDYERLRQRRDPGRHAGMNDGSQVPHSTPGGRSDGDSDTRALQLVSAAYLKFVKTVAKTAGELTTISEHEQRILEAGSARKIPRPPRRSHR